MAVKKNPIRYALVILMFLALTMNGFTNMVFSARAVDVMELYNMTQAQLSSISGVSNLGGFFFSILMGYMIDKFGVRKFPGLVFILATAVAVLRIFAGSYWMLWILTFISSALWLPATMLAPKLFSYYFDQKEMASAIGVYQSGAGLGTTLAFAIAAMFPSTQAALTFIAVAMGVITVAWFIMVKDPEAEARKNGQIPVEAPKANLNMFSVLKSPTMIKVMLCGGLSVGCAILINSYAVTCMIGKGMDPAMAGQTATLMNLCLLFGGMVAGFLVDKIGKYNIPYLLICAVGGIGYYLVYAFVPTGVPTMIGMCVCAFIVAGSIGVNMGRIALIPMTGEFGPEMGGAAGGMNQTAAGLFGWLFPVIIATIFQDNYVGMFTCGAVCLVVLGLFGLTVPELGNKGKIAQAARAKEQQ